MVVLKMEDSDRYTLISTGIDKNAALANSFLTIVIEFFVARIFT